MPGDSISYFVWFLFILFFLNTSSSQASSSSHHEVSKHKKDWDVLIFTQHWPATVCYQWREREDRHRCSMPSNDIWTVHGIWPTKFGTVGPAFCNDTWKFDQEQLEPIQDQLNRYWINIEKDTPRNSLWKHEWMKHGTCAAVLPELNTENKYFSKGLEWLQEYSMSKVLQRVDIQPNNTFDPIEIYSGVKKVLNKNPAMECMHDVKTGLSYIFEIRICFDKQLKLTDCDGIKSRLRHLGDSKILTNCDLHKQVIYPEVIELPKKSVLPQEDIPYQWSIFDLYKLIYFIQWFTF
uniref:Putative ribonuclease t2 family n=1 Tax=Xenopsylla cheopis TaxID=163159 RepID=A0A6M2DY26_XENCH